MKKRGFTFIELLMVLTILTILIGIVFVNYQVYVNRARDKRVLEQINSLRDAISIYYTEHNGTFPESLGELYPKYLSRIDLKWEGSLGDGTILYDVNTGSLKLNVRSGRLDSQGQPYEEY